MPSPSQFLHAFGLDRKGQIFDPPGLVLERVEIKEVPVRKYHLYQYPITMTFGQLKGRSITKEQVEQFLKIKLGGSKRVLATINYYSCQMGAMNDISLKGKKFLVHTIGRGVNVGPRAP